MHTKLEYILKMIVMDAVYKAVSPPDGLFAEQEPYPDLFCFLREGKGIFKPGF